MTRFLGLGILAIGIIISCGTLPKGGSGSSLSREADGSTLTIAAGTFDSDQPVNLSTLSAVTLPSHFDAHNGSISLNGMELSSAAEVVIGNGSKNVLLNQNVIVGLQDNANLSSVSSMKLRAAIMPTYARIYCQLYDGMNLGELLAITAITASGGILTFSFGKGYSISGFLCMLIVNTAKQEVRAPTVTSDEKPLVPTGIGGS